MIPTVTVFVVSVWGEEYREDSTPNITWLLSGSV
jgi:hypothetical protein